MYMVAVEEYWGTKVSETKANKPLALIAAARTMIQSLWTKISHRSFMVTIFVTFFFYDCLIYDERKVIAYFVKGR